MYIELLLQHKDAGALMLLYDGNKNTPLHVACELGDLEIVKLLFRYLDIKRALIHPNDAGNTPLHLACIGKHRDVVEKLIEHSDITDVFGHQNNDGNTPLHLDQKEIYRVLIHHPDSGAACGLANKQGKTAIVLYSEMNPIGALRPLLD